MSRLTLSPAATALFIWLCTLASALAEKLPSLGSIEAHEADTTTSLKPSLAKVASLLEGSSAPSNGPVGTLGWLELPLLVVFVDVPPLVVLAALVLAVPVAVLPVPLFVAFVESDFETDDDVAVLFLPELLVDVVWFPDAGSLSLLAALS